jgi:hypothetical protein
MFLFGMQATYHGDSVAIEEKERASIRLSKALLHWRIEASSPGSQGFDIELLISSCLSERRPRKVY